MILWNTQPDFYSEIQRVELLKKLGNKLEMLNEFVNFEIFRPELEHVFPKPRFGLVGRPSFDAVLMFKILILQRLYSLSDEQAEFQINDRISFMHFLSIGLDAKVPDAKTIWAYREKLKDGNVAEKLFDLFNEMLLEKGFLAKTGVIVDSTIVEVPRPQLPFKEKQAMKDGQIPESRKDNDNALNQTDLDARFTKKHNKTYYGYKNHVIVDAVEKLIIDYKVTPASTADIEVFKEFIDQIEANTRVWGDKAYFSEETEKLLSNKEANSEVLVKGTRGNPLTEMQKFFNSVKSKTRARIEHIFGYFTNSMAEIKPEVIGQERNAVVIGLENLAYNMLRYCFLTKYSA